MLVSSALIIILGSVVRFLHGMKINNFAKTVWSMLEIFALAVILRFYC